MKYMIMLYGSQEFYDMMAGKPGAAQTMSPEELASMHDYMESLHRDLAESGELVDAQGLTAPAHARRVTLSAGAPVVTDGPYAETTEVLAGYTIVDCESFDRATEIAARFINPESESEYVDVRPVLEGVEELHG